VLEALILLNAALVVLCTALYYRVRQLESTSQASREVSREELREALRVVRAAREQLAALPSAFTDNGRPTTGNPFSLSDPGIGVGEATWVGAERSDRAG
jgi:hypothetical protein